MGRFFDNLIDYILGTLIFLVLAAIFFTIADKILGTTHSESFIVVEKTYTPSTTGTGVGPSYSGGSGSGVAVVITQNPEKYTLILQTYSDITPIEVGRKEWAATKIGDKITIPVTVGKWTEQMYFN